MRFIINNLVFDTEKMKLMSDKVKKKIKDNTLPGIFSREKSYDSELYKSNKGRYLLKVFFDFQYIGIQVDVEEVKELLKEYDYDAYVKEFGELEEA